MKSLDSVHAIFGAITGTFSRAVVGYAMMSVSVFLSYLALGIWRPLLLAIWPFALFWNCFNWEMWIFVPLIALLVMVVQFFMAIREGFEAFSIYALLAFPPAIILLPSLYEWSGQEPLPPGFWLRAIEVSFLFVGSVIYWWAARQREE